MNKGGYSRAKAELATLLEMAGIDALLLIRVAEQVKPSEFIHLMRMDLFLPETAPAASTSGVHN